MSWTLNSTGGDLVGDNGATFAIVFRSSPSLPFIHENQLVRLRIQRKRCEKFYVIGRTERKPTNDTSLTKSENVCVATARILDSEETREKGGHVRKMGNRVPCAAGCGRIRSHFRIDPTPTLGGCPSVDISGPHVPGIWPAPDGAQFIVTRKPRYFLVAHCQTYTPKEVNIILSREHEAAEFTSQAHDLGGTREEEQMERGLCMFF